MNDLTLYMHRLAARLEHAGIPYMIGGSVASGIYGDARNTQDVDFIIHPTLEQLKAFLAAVECDCFHDVHDIEETFKNRRMFNVIERRTNWKADMIFRLGYRFEREAFDRRCSMPVSGKKIYLASPEDVILSKLDWSRESQSELQARDVLGVLCNKLDMLDMDYLVTNARHLDLESRLMEIVKQAQILREQDTDD